jgi:hypothetical protein
MSNMLFEKNRFKFEIESIFSPNRKFSLNNTQVAKNQNSRAESKDQPDFIVLGQEMAHALGQMDGAGIPESMGTKMNTYKS